MTVKKYFVIFLSW